MTITYEKITSDSGSVTIVKTNNESDIIVLIPVDESNSDYQAYLRWLENPNAQQGANLND